MATRIREKAQARAESRDNRPHAVARMIRMSPYKVRSVLDVIRGKSYIEAVALLNAMNKAACEPVLKVVNSAAANAENELRDMSHLHLICGENHVKRMRSIRQRNVLSKSSQDCTAYFLFS